MSCSGTAQSPSRSAALRRWKRSSRMPPELRGKVAVVTGVGRVGQIGHAVARGFGRAGAQLVIADVNAAGLADRAKEFTVEGFAARAVAGGFTPPAAAPRGGPDGRERFGGVSDLVQACASLGA